MFSFSLIVRIGGARSFGFTVEVPTSGPASRIQSHSTHWGSFVTESSVLRVDSVREASALTYKSMQYPKEILLNGHVMIGYDSWDALSLAPIKSV
jgi:hypothetical protein